MNTNLKISDENFGRDRIRKITYAPVHGPAQITKTFKFLHLP